MNRVFFIAALLCVPLVALGGETRIWEVSKPEAFIRGEELENVIVGPRGEMRLGYEHESIDMKDEPSFWSGHVEDSGAIWVGTGKGAIYRIEGGKAEKAFETGEMLVTSFAESGGRLYAATIPNGKIFHREGAEWKAFAKVDAKYVWKIAPAPEGGLYAACGGEGRIFRVNAEGGVEKIFPETADSPLKCENVLCLRQEGDALIAGTAAPGYLLRLENGTTRVLYDFEEGEVKSAVRRGEAWYVAVNAGQKMPPSDFLRAVEEAKTKEVPPQEPAGRPQGAEQEEEGEAIPPSARGGGGGVQSAIWKISAARTEEVLRFPSSYVTELAAWEGGVVAGTNNSGRIFRLLEDGGHELLFDFKEGQALGFIESNGSARGALMGSRAALKLFSGERAKKGTYLSEVLDARFQTEWGVLKARSTGAVTIQTRSGQIAKAGEGWSNWSPPLASGQKISNPKGRYLQFRILMEDPEARVGGVSIAYRPENQRPRVRELKIHVVPPMPEMGMMGPMGREPGPSPRLGEPHSFVKRISWIGEDADNDYLVYRIYIKQMDGGAWMPLLGKSSTPMIEYPWNTENVPDGQYLVKVVASDEKANPADDVLTGEAEIGPILIDNTKPEISVVSIDAAKASVVVEDRASNVSRFEYAIDGGEWSSLAPKDRLFDQRREEFEIALPKLAAGAHTLVLRALDQESNIGTISKTFEVK